MQCNGLRYKLKFLSCNLESVTDYNLPVIYLVLPTEYSFIVREKSRNIITEYQHSCDNLCLPSADFYRQFVWIIALIISYISLLLPFFYDVCLNERAENVDL